MIPLWPWQLSALTSRAIGAWGVGIGVLALQAICENDFRRLAAFMLSYFVYGLLQNINLLRYPAELDWSRSSTYFYAVFVLSVLLAGGHGYRQSKRFQQTQN